MPGKSTLVLVSPDLRTRSFLRAQLIEEGIKVSAFKTIDDARHWIYIGGRVPSLTLVDVWKNPLSPESIRWLRDISDRSPVIFLTGARGRVTPEMEALGETLRRPVTVNDIISRIRSRL
jgi:DNA-binding response OmpR family regulator